MARLTVACIQNHPGPVLADNVAGALALARRAAADGAGLVCLPEYFAFLAMDNEKLVLDAAPEAGHPALTPFQALAADQGCSILLGSVAIKVADAVGGDKVYNRSFLIGPDGQVAAHYDKIHLFDVMLPGGEDYRESASVLPGHRAVLARVDGITLGLSICYDLRFAALYRSLAQAGAEVLTVPAAFTRTTGEAHWHALLRARAIETGCYVVAPSQWGEHAGTGGPPRACYGHSLIVDPWGVVLADGGPEGDRIVTAEIDSARVAEARSRVPALTHDRAFDLAPPSGTAGQAAAE